MIVIKKNNKIVRTDGFLKKEKILKENPAIAF